MLAILGFVMMIVFMYLIMSNRLSALIALIVVPIVFALISGFGKDLGEMMIQALQTSPLPVSCCYSPSCISAL